MKTGSYSVLAEQCPTSSDPKTPKCSDLLSSLFRILTRAKAASCLNIFSAVRMNWYHDSVRILLKNRSRRDFHDIYSPGSNELFVSLLVENGNIEGPFYEVYKRRDGAHATEHVFWKLVQLIIFFLASCNFVSPNMRRTWRCH